MTDSVSWKSVINAGLINAITFGFYPACSVTNLLICSYFSKQEPLYQASFGLGNLAIGIFFESIGISFASSVETLASQAHGAKQTKLKQLILRRAYLLNMIIYVIILLPTLFIKPIFVQIGQETNLIPLATKFVILIGLMEIFNF